MYVKTFILHYTDVNLKIQTSANPGALYKTVVNSWAVKIGF